MLYYTQTKKKIKFLEIPIILVDAEELSEKIMTEKVAVFGDKVSVSGMDIDVAAEIRDMVDVLIPAE